MTTILTSSGTASTVTTHHGSVRMAAIGLIWVATALTAITAPDMVSGSEHEHLPIAAITVWLWAAVATGYAAMTPVENARDWLVGIAVVWGAMAAASIFAPVMETGSDPTQIPIAALVAPPVAAVVTGYLALSQASGLRRTETVTTGRRSSRRGSVGPGSGSDHGTRRSRRRPGGR